MAIQNKTATYKKLNTGLYMHKFTKFFAMTVVIKIKVSHESLAQVHLKHGHDY